MGIVVLTAQQALFPDREPMTPEARNQIAIETGWPKINRRRGSLIKKEIADTITEAEQVELNSLQAYADCYIEQVAPRPPCHEPMARARRTDPETSHQAAATVDVTRSQRLVLEVLREYPHSTFSAELIARLLRSIVPPSRVRGALRELQDCDPPRVVVVDRRENEEGNPASVYRAIES